MENSRFEQRRGAIEERLPERRLDALLVSLSPNLRYLSGFTGSNGALLVTRGGAILFTDSRYQIQAAQESSCRVRIAKGPVLMDVLAAIARPGPAADRLRAGAHDLRVLRIPAIAAADESHAGAAGGWIEELRMVKSPEELATDPAQRGDQLARLRADRRAPEARDAGAATWPRNWSTACGGWGRRSRASIPSWPAASGPRCRTRSPAARAWTGGLVVIDMGAMLDGYASDMTRMLHVGAPSAKVKRMYRAVLEAQLAAIDAVRPGARTAAIDGAARRVLKGYGLDRAFTHSTGHGLGLEIHEPPRLGRRTSCGLRRAWRSRSSRGSYLEGFGGVRIEDTVVVTPGGCEILTPTSKELRLIG